MFVHSLCFKNPKYKPNWLTGKILGQNGLQGDFRNAKIDRRPKDGVYLSFEAISPGLNEVLNKMTQMDCILGTSLLEKRMRKVRTESEFLEMCGKDPNFRV